MKFSIQIGVVKLLFCCNHVFFNLSLPFSSENIKFFTFLQTEINYFMILIKYFPTLINFKIIFCRKKTSSNSGPTDHLGPENIFSGPHQSTFFGNTTQQKHQKYLEEGEYFNGVQLCCHTVGLVELLDILINPTLSYILVLNFTITITTVQCLLTTTIQQPLSGG